MNVNFTFRQIEANEKLKEIIEEKFERLNKFIANDGTDINLVILQEKHLLKIELTMACFGKIFKSVNKSKDILTSVDNVIDKLETQLKRNKDKIIKKKKGAKDKTSEMISLKTP